MDKPLDITKIDTEKKAATAIRKLGYVRAPFDMTRGAKTYCHPELERSNGGLFQITVAPHNWLSTGRSWGHIPMLMHVDNMKTGAAARTLEMLARLRELGVLPTDGEVGLWGLAVAVAAGALEEARTAQVTA